jgi:hypothetical protein
VNALSSRCLQHSDSLCTSKGGKSNLFGSNIKYSVVVGHEGEAHGPGIALTICPDTAKAIGGTRLHETTTEVLCYWEGNTTKVKGNVRENGVARENVESLLNRFRTRDLVVDFTNVLKRASDGVGSL